jgi:hypothetical protein
MCPQQHNGVYALARHWKTKMLVFLRVLHWNQGGQKESDGTLLDSSFPDPSRLPQKTMFSNGFPHFCVKRKVSRAGFFGTAPKRNICLF